MDAMAEFSSHMQELLASKSSEQIYPFMTQYTFWLFISIVLFFVLMIYAAKSVKLIPKGLLSGGIEHLMEWFRQDVGYNVMGKDADRHMPFLMTIFFFILVSNLIGLIPGVSVATGAMGVTVALAVISFLYFVIHGIKAQGLAKYIGSFAPKGVFFPMNVLVWLIELFSTFLRIVTLSVRLFANMYAGHLILGAFAILASVYIGPVIQDFTLAALTGALPGIFWMVFLIVMYFMELMVACLQAYVFSLLSSVYIQLAIQEEH